MTAPAPAPALRRELGLASASLLVVGGIIGSGIFFTPAEVGRALPTSAWILGVWAGGGLVALAGALTFAELGAMLPEAGGPYVYIREAFGPLVAFLQSSGGPVEVDRLDLESPAVDALREAGVALVVPLVFTAIVASIAALRDLGNAARLVGQTLTDTFTYTMADAANATSSTTLTITITGANDNPVAVADVATLNEDSQTTIQASALLAFVVPCSWPLFGLWAASHFIRAIGLTLAYHRYYAHRAFQMNRGARFFWTLMALGVTGMFLSLRSRAASKNR